VRADFCHILLADAVFKIVQLPMDQEGVIIHRKDNRKTEKDQCKEN
jgi:hypothetical protein